LAHKRTAEPSSFSEYWDSGSCGLTGALAPWSERRYHSGRVRKATPDRPPHGTSAVRRGGGREARKNGGLCSWLREGGWCERWRDVGATVAEPGGGRDVGKRSILPRAAEVWPKDRPHSPSECKHPPPPPGGVRVTVGRSISQSLEIANEFEANSGRCTQCRYFKTGYFLVLGVDLKASEFVRIACQNP
jgi:hypothetical protein